MIVGTNSISKLISHLGTKFEKFLKYEPCNSDFMVDKVFDLNILDIHAFVMHTPGHTEGSQSLIVDNEIAIVGDAMFGIFSNSSFPPFVADVPVLMKSWKSLLESHCSLFLPAHGSVRTRELVAACKIIIKEKYMILSMLFMFNLVFELI